LSLQTQRAKRGHFCTRFLPWEVRNKWGHSFGSETWTDQKTVPRGGKYNLFSVAVHELGHCIGLFHNTEDKDSVMQPICKPGFSVENKNKILSESDIKTVQEMYGAAKI